MFRGRLVVGFGVLALGVAWACFNAPDTGVHFNDVVDFGSPPPPLVISAWEENAHRSVPNSVDAINYDPEKAVKFDAEREAALSIALASESTSSLIETKKLYQEAFNTYQKLANEPTDTDKMMSARTEFIRERLEVLNSTRAKAFMGAVPDPATKRSVHVDVLRKLATDSTLAPNANYVLATQATGTPEAVADTFEKSAVKGSARREPGLIMAARALLAQSSSKIPPTRIARGRTDLKLLLAEFPTTRFRWSALGWLARCDWLSGQRADAMTTYLWQHRNARNLTQRVGSISSMKQVFASLNKTDAEAVRAAIMRHGDLLQPYVDFRLYHSKSSDLVGLAKFASEVLAKNPSSQLSGEIEARLAEIAYASKDFTKAFSFAKRSSSKASIRQDLATYVLASCQKRAGQMETAIATISDFDSKFPNSYLVPSAKELRAIWAEVKGDWSTAISVYSSLNYRQDLAYLLDIRIPIDALAKIKPTGDKALSDLVAYSYGMRLMRKMRFKEAIETFESIPAAARKKMAHAETHDFAWSSDSKSPTDRSFDPAETCATLLGLKAKTDASSDPADLYEFANFYYSHRNLLLYNAPLWDGSREIYLSYFFNDHIATLTDTNAVREHHHEHECLMIARSICLNIADQHRNSDLAPRALYRAACASRRLADFNGWWRRENKRTDMWNSAVDLMAKVHKEYPQSPLATNAAKYEKVFRDEAKGQATAQLFAMDERP